jgi:hypothetical protein
LLIDNTATAHLPGPQNPGVCHLYLAEGCHLYIAFTVSLIIGIYGKSLELLHARQWAITIAFATHPSYCIKSLLFVWRTPRDATARPAEGRVPNAAREISGRLPIIARGALLNGLVLCLSVGGPLVMRRQ